jgi:hypothetical protein
MIRRTILLRAGPDRAFVLFTEHASTWWPPGRRHTGDEASSVLLEPGGRFWERARDGREVELGRVLAWEPGRRLELDFYPGTDAARPTRVVVRFEPADGGTQVIVEHRPTAASEAVWDERAPAYERSWALVLDALAAADAGFDDR